MSSVWEFVKRHRGKVILGGVVVGGIYVGQKVLANSRFAQLESPFSVNNLTLQSRKHYIFDSNQRTCDNSVIQLVPSLKSKFQNRFDIENLLDLLKNGDADKIKIWQDIKLMSFIRLVGSCYSFTLLIVSLKLQISIIAADIYSKSLQNSSTATNFLEKIFGGWLNGTSSVKPKPNSNIADASTQQIFLQALHYFVTQGSTSFVDRIETIVGEVLNKISLKEELTFDQFQQLFNNIRSKIDASDCTNYSNFVVPLMTNRDVASSSSVSELDELLVLLKNLLDSTSCKHVINYCLNEFFNHIFEFARRLRNDEWFANDDEETPKKIPLAKIIPMISDCFHHVSQTDFDSIVHNLLISSPVHEFCVKIFEKDFNLL